MRHIPNILCIFRIILVGVFIAFFCNEQYLACIIVYCTAFFTDILDGYLARRNNWISDIGKLLDPLADKLMLISALSCFFFRGWLPWPILAIAVVKELLMIFGGIFLLKKRNTVVYADWFGKTAAGFFNVGVILTLIKNFVPTLGNFDWIIYSMAIVLAVIALFHYAKQKMFGHSTKDAESK
ncbi:MAG: CDP-alcohol phosphatidyltransferase family protein [Clostridia bacterium]|nr:CDP-alcohol phosphatidyltransferase family protein [Clostridia bacterium]